MGIWVTIHNKVPACCAIKLIILYTNGITIKYVYNKQGIHLHSRDYV